jgi:hypothetical protein
MKSNSNEIALGLNVNREINARLKKIINKNIKYKLINDEITEVLEDIKGNFSLKYNESKVYSSLFNKHIIPKCQFLFNIIYTGDPGENTLTVGSRDKLNVNDSKFYFIDRIFSILDKYHDIISIQLKSNIKYDNIIKIIKANLFILLEDAKRELFFNKQIKFVEQKAKEEYKLCKSFINYCDSLTSRGNINIDFEHICLCFMFKILLSSGNYDFCDNNKELVEIIQKNDKDVIVNSDKINPINFNVFNNKMFSSSELIDNGHLKPTNLNFKMYFPLNKKELLLGDVRIRMFSHLLYTNNKSFYVILVEINNNGNYEYIIHKINYYPIPVSGKYIYDILNTNFKLFNHLKDIIGPSASISDSDICIFLDLFMNDKTIKDEQNVLQLRQTSLLDNETAEMPPICKIYTQDKLSASIAFLLKYTNNNIINKESSILYYVEKNANELKQFLGVMPNNVIYSNMYNSTSNNDIIMKLIKGVKKYLKRKDKVITQPAWPNLGQGGTNIKPSLLPHPMEDKDEKEDERVVDMINTETIELLMETREIKINNEDKIMSYHHILSNNFLNILYLNQSNANIIIDDFDNVSFKDNKIKEHVNFIKEINPIYFEKDNTIPKNILIKEWYINELNKTHKSKTKTNTKKTQTQTQTQTQKKIDNLKKIKKQTRRAGQ